MEHLLSAANASMEKVRKAKARYWDANTDVKSVSIVTMNGDKPQVKLEVLGRILHEYKDHPVAIISVFGDFRGGKSFLWNLLCQYLMQKQPKDWIKKEEELVKVFNWRTGTKSHTTGIDITNKPFMLENDKGEEIAVYLMDTQGSFDNKMTAGECSLIFALSILISSFQIYNLPSGLIRDSDLQQLGLFLQHANTTVKKKDSNASEPSLLFSPLMFLVRNYQMPDYDYGSKGGMGYLEEVMESDEDENKYVRKKIKEGFPDVRCHLLPDPGTKVKQCSDSSQLTLTDIDDGFLEGVDDLAKCLFSKDSLVVKQLNGKACTGEVLMRLAEELDNMIKSGQTPKVHTLIKVNEIVEFYKKIDEFESEYVATMNSKGEKYIDPKILKTFHDKCFQKAMQQYEEHDVFKPDESKKQCQKLKTRLDGCYGIIKQENKARKVRERNKIMDEVDVAGKVYFEEMKRVAGGQHLEDVITAKAGAERKAVKLFKTSTTACNPDLVKECENKLHEAIQLKHREFKRINANQLKLLLQDLSNLANDCRMGYVEIMEVK
ncbi:atlastin-1 isoform X1 [Ciona intestinalis]